MKFKILLLAVLISIVESLPVPEPSKLLRKPKVYNAVITTDDNLSPSRAYPLIQPIVHETPIAYPYSPFRGFPGAPPFRFYNYYSEQGQQEVQSRNSIKDIQQEDNEPEDKSPGATIEEADTIQQVPDVNRNDQPIKNTAETEERKTERPPIELNEFGLPPNLIPLSSYQNPNPYNLQPYSYTNYPLIYDSQSGAGYQQQQGSLLPPYTFYQPHAQPHPKKKHQPSQQLAPTEIPPRSENPPPPSRLLPVSPPLSPSDIINYTKKNKNIPDVPPPPLPTSSRQPSSS